MSENTDIGTETMQENSEKSENIQENVELNSENNDPSSEDTQDHSKNDDDSNGEEDGLDLPEPDISEEERKKKKEMPEWMKKKLEREKAAAERKEQEALELKRENELLRQRNPSQEQQNVQHPFDPNMPQRDQFRTEAEYFVAVADYRDAVRHNAFVNKQREEHFKKAEKTYQDGLSTAIDDGREKYTDFDTRTHHILYGEGFPSNRAMGEAIVESEYKSDILYFLGTHITEAEKIASMNPVKAAMEIQKLAIRFAAKRKSTLTKAPKPITPLGGGKGTATNKDPSKMEMDEFTSWYQNTYS